ncbi:MAG TPA: septum site-determining protein Ssd [Stackebrandtia sp.]|uniref:septum site-determining protein Ssd n=1 Tax=Stackebrandtia sp. TaxID=2023065 RepID=UPI002D6EFAAA|nr:septum site-determining protein Ssd [Stackebrandtia sp.]HZE41786.1 septum site-determining protein Ssd [Stackebrandtia sp.]
MDDLADARPLFITAEPRTETDLLTLASAAGTGAWIAPDTARARRYWAAASAIVIGADLVRDCAEARLPHRRDVVLLTGDHLAYDEAWPLALSLGADQVASLPQAAAWLTGRLAPASPPGTTAAVLAITGARGGVGASVLAASVALNAAARGLATTLIDTDAHGGGLDLVLGWEGLEGLRWPDISATDGPFDPERLRERLPSKGRLGLLSFHRQRDASPPHDLFATVIEAACRSCDLVVVDVPRYGESRLLDELAGADLVALVVPAEVRGIAAARRVVAETAVPHQRLRAVARVPSPGGLEPDHIAASLGVGVLAELRTDPRLGPTVESGKLGTRALRGPMSATSQSLINAVTTPDRHPAPATGDAR